jgi:hypothetical protein
LNEQCADLVALQADPLLELAHPLAQVHHPDERDQRQDERNREQRKAERNHSFQCRLLRPVAVYWTVSTERDGITVSLEPRFPGRSIGTARFIYVEDRLP